MKRKLDLDPNETNDEDQPDKKKRKIGCKENLEQINTVLKTFHYDKSVLKTERGIKRRLENAKGKIENAKREIEEQEEHINRQKYKMNKFQDVKRDIRTEYLIEKLKKGEDLFFDFR